MLHAHAIFLWRGQNTSFNAGCKRFVQDLCGCHGYGKQRLHSNISIAMATTMILYKPLTASIEAGVLTFP